MKINDKDYTFLVQYKEDDKLRASFNSLTRAIYRFDFEQWYKSGYWTDSCLLYSLADGDCVITHVSVNVIDFIILGKKTKTVQLGTVMTDPNYRNQGLNRILMERVLKEWEDKCDLLYHFAQNSIPLSKISMRDNAGLIMFYANYFDLFSFRDKFYYIADLQAIAIAEQQGTALVLYDVLALSEVMIKDIINTLADENTEKTILGFTPMNTQDYEVNLFKEEDTTLFVQSKNASLFEESKLLFPILSHT